MINLFSYLCQKKLPFDRPLLWIRLFLICPAWTTKGLYKSNKLIFPFSLHYADSMKLLLFILFYFILICLFYLSSCFIWKTSSRINIWVLFKLYFEGHFLPFERKLIGEEMRVTASDRRWWSAFMKQPGRTLESPRTCVTRAWEQVRISLCLFHNISGLKRILSLETSLKMRSESISLC